jgi:putative membrane protein
LKKFIFFLCNDITVWICFNLGYYVVPVVVFIFYVLASLELIAEEIEEPLEMMIMIYLLENSRKHQRHVEELI